MAASESGAYRGVAALPESMHAAVLHAPGDLRYEVVRTPRPRPGHVVVRVAVAGHCGSDLARIMITGTYSFPTIPGHEFAGRVAAIAEDVDAAWLERRVAVIPLIPCGQCEYCRTGWAHLCLRYSAATCWCSEWAPSARLRYSGPAYWAQTASLRPTSTTRSSMWHGNSVPTLRSIQRVLIYWQA